MRILRTRQFLTFTLLMVMLFPVFVMPSALADISITISDSDDPTSAVEIVTDDSDGGGSTSAKEAFIDGILSLAEEKFDDTNGRAQRAAYKSDIYICKNFTVYLFKENADDFRMEEYPDTPLVIPNNKPKKECIEYVYGAEWIDVPASEGNPFYAAATFRYDADKTMAENREIARDFLKQVQRGDYFQMAANYYYGIGAHSMIFSSDYDAENDSVHWTDSNMKGKTVNDERYGYVQYDAEKEIDWFVDAFCRKKYGATIYRLRDDIIWAD